MRYRGLKDLLEHRGIKITDVHWRIRVPMSTARRYWYGTRNGREDGLPLTSIDIETIGKIQKEFAVTWNDLFGEDRRRRYTATAQLATV